jgi:hypothetical protein
MKFGYTYKPTRTSSQNSIATKPTTKLKDKEIHREKRSETSPTTSTESEQRNDDMDIYIDGGSDSRQDERSIEKYESYNLLQSVYWIFNIIGKRTRNNNRKGYGEDHYQLSQSLIRNEGSILSLYLSGDSMQETKSQITRWNHSIKEFTYNSLQLLQQICTISCDNFTLGIYYFDGEEVSADINTNNISMDVGNISCGFPAMDSISYIIANMLEKTLVDANSSCIEYSMNVQCDSSPFIAMV